MMKTKLASAVASVLAGTALSLGGIPSASAGTVNYNAFNHSRPAPNVIVGGNSSTAPGGAGTDGWMRTLGQDPDPLGLTPGSTYTTDGHSYGQGPDAGNNSNNGAAVQWVGTDPRLAVGSGGFGYGPTLANRQTPTLNWTAELSSDTDSVTVSYQDSATRYGGTVLADGTTFQFADIDTAKGAWHDGGATNPAAPTGWRHDTDIGLFRSSVTQDVTLNISSLGPENFNAVYGITIFQGMSPNANGSYNHHGGWHLVSNAAAIGVQGSGPFEPAGTDITGTTNPNGFGGAGGLTFVLDDVLNNNAVFTAQAGVIYSIYLGGFQGGDWTTTRDNYQLEILGQNAAPVPIPAAVWLFGSALAGMGVVGRRKDKPAA